MNDLSKKDAESIAMSINLLFGNAKMFGARHPSTEKAATDLCGKVNETASGESNHLENPLISFIKSGKSFYIEKWLVDSKINHSRFMTDFEKLLIESISFMSGVSVKNIVDFVEMFVYALENKITADKIQDILTKRNEKSIIINYIVFEKVRKGESVTQTPKDVISHLDKLFNLRSAIESNSFSQNNQNFNFVSNELFSLQSKIREQKDSSEIDYDSLFNSLADVSKIVKSTEYLFNDQKDGEKEKILSQIDRMTQDAILKIIKDEIRQERFSVKKLVLLVKRLDPSKEELQLLLPKIKNAMLEAGLNTSDYLDFVMDLGNKFSEERAMDKIFDKAGDFGVKPSEIVEAFSQNPQECVKLLLQSAEIQKTHIFDTNLSDYLANMLDNISRDAALQKIKMQKIGGDVNNVISSVISAVNDGLLTKLKENGLEYDTTNKIQKGLMEKFPKTLEHLKNEWLVNALGNAENLTQDAIVKVLTQVIGTNGEDENIYKESLSSFSEKFNLLPEEITEILENVKKQKELMEQKKDLPLLPPKTTIHFIKRYIEEYKRHKHPFSIIMVSDKTAKTVESALNIAEKAAFLLADSFRILDLSGFVRIRGKDIAVVILPMTGSDGLKKVMEKIDGKVDLQKYILTYISYEEPDESETYEMVMKKLLREHFSG